MLKPFFQMEDELLTGIRVIDEQHQGLINIINDTFKLCVNGSEIESATIEEIDRQLNTYVAHHFQTEEELMRNHGIDERHVKMHLHAHESFRSTLAAYFADSASLMDREKMRDVLEYLIRWLAYHILDTDKSLVRQIQEMKDSQTSPESAFLKEDSYVKTSNEPLLKALKALFVVVLEKNSYLELLNKTLEEKVSQRTQELSLAYEKLLDITMRDELTGLFNRRYAIQELERLVQQWKRYQTVLSLLYIDVDKFKPVNDQFGHEYGDKVLCWIADYLTSALRKTDIICRLGGDEFLVICAHCDEDSAMELAKKINHGHHAHAKEEIQHIWSPSLSIGVAGMDAQCHTVNDILKKADAAMYLAKSEGGGRAALAEDA